MKLSKILVEEGLLKTSGAVKQARALSPALVRQLRKLPEFKKVLKAMARSQDFDDAIEGLLGDHAGDYDLWEIQTGVSAPSMEHLLGEYYGSRVFTDFKARSSQTRQAADKLHDAMEALLRANGITERNLDRAMEDAYLELDPLTQDWLDNVDIEDRWDYILNEHARDFYDEEESERDPYAYHGVSRRDFMARLRKT